MLFSVITVNANNLGIRPLTVRPVTAQLRPTVIGLPGAIVPGTSILAASPTVTHTSPASANTQSLTTPAVVLSKAMGLAVTTPTNSLPCTIVSTAASQTLTPVNHHTLIRGAQPATLGTQSVTLNAPSTVGTQNMTIGTQGVTLATMKHIITAPYPGLQTAQIVSPAQIQQLVAQQVNRSRGTVPQIVTPAANSVQAVITSIPVTQLVSPVTVVSPNVPLANAAALTHAQPTQLYNNQLSSQVLKTLGQIPIIQQSAFSLPIKPVVMVTMPSVVTTAAAPIVNPAAVQVAMPTAPHSNSTL